MVPDVNKVQYDKRSPLHLASCQYNKEVALILIKNGANINAKDNTGETPLHKSIECLSLDPYIFFSRHNDINFKLDKEINLLSLLIKNGANINTKNEKGETPLT